MIESGKFLQQRYRIDKQIGQGGMGAVYVATDERFGSTVAIKETLCMDANFRKAIEREARLLNSLKHGALPRVSDHFEEADSQFLVMEYIPGDDVGSMLDGGAKFSTEQVLKWANQLLDALDYLHTQDVPVIHRDIKPQNLKINKRGDMILLDFGLAKGNPTDAGHNTAAKSIFGYSRNYASLEQIQGTGTDPRSDLYSLAATLYHLLTNVAPEDALTRAMAVLSQRPDPLVPASSLNANVPRGLAGVLQRSMALNADERPRTAADMREMLRDSEKYGYLVDAVTFAASAGTTADLRGKTQAMAAETYADSRVATEAKTEVLPIPDSQLTALSDTDANSARTRIAPLATTDATPRRGSFASMAAGALLLLLVGGAVAGGIYVFKPSVFGVGNEDKVEQNSLLPATNANTENTSVDTNINSVQVGIADNTNSVNAASEPSRTTTTTATKAPETAKSEAKKPEPESDTVITDDDGTTVRYSADGKKMIVTERHGDGSTSTTTLENPSGVPAIRRPPPNEAMPFPRIDPSRLTPEQRRKLQRVLRNQRMNNPTPPQPDRP